MSSDPRRRSRFDQGGTAPSAAEPPQRASRFDRRSRSRSPSKNDSSSAQRSRSPLPSASNKESNNPDAASSAAKAAAAAARINAMIQAKKAAGDIPAVSPAPGVVVPPPQSESHDPPEKTEGVYQQDGDFIKDIEVNDLRNRYTLTKGATQKDIKEKTGADVTTRGNYYPDKAMATPQAPPLYLHVTSQTKEGLEKALAMIDDLMAQDLPELIDVRRYGRRPQQEQQPQPERVPEGRRKWPEARIPIDLEPIPGFNLRARVVGQGGQNVKWIQSETRCRVQIKGRGSSFKEVDTQMESDEDMFLHVAGPDPSDVENAREKCLELLESVRNEYEAFKARPQRDRGGRGGHGGYGRGGFDDRSRGEYGRDRQDSSYGGGGQYGGGSQYGGHGQYNGGSQYGGSSQYGDAAQYGAYPQYGADASSYNAYNQQAAAAYGAGAQPSQTGADASAATTVTPEQYQMWAQYYAQHPEQDPYAAYGGFGAYMAYYSQAVQGQTPSPAAPQNGHAAYQAPPPPPGGDVAPPPPPPGNDGHNTAGSPVPAPPGLG